LRALQREPADRYANAADMKAEIDTVDQVRVTGLADRLQEPTSWEPRLFQRPWVLAMALLTPCSSPILVLSFLLLRRHLERRKRSLTLLFMIGMVNRSRPR